MDKYFQSFKTRRYVLKSFLRIETVLMAAVATTAVSIVVGCSSQKDAPQVTTSFSMTGSGSAATVAQTTILRKLWDMILPSSYAFVPASMLDSSGATVVLNEAWIMIKEIEFEVDEDAGNDEVDGEGVEFAGPYAVDLLTTAPTALDSQPIPQLPYKRIKMKLHKAESAVTGAPAGLLNNSIYFSGTVGANSFTYESDDTTEFEIGGANAVLPTDGGAILVQIQLANVIKQIDLSGLPNGATVSASSRYAGSNLCPSIDASANDVYTCFRNGLSKHANWGCDQDGDDDLDDNDDSVK